MMELDEAIKHCLKVASENDSQAAEYNEHDEWEFVNKCNCEQRAADHRQLAEWLTELKNRREVSEIEKRSIEKCDNCSDILDCPLYYPWLKE